SCWMAYLFELTRRRPTTTLLPYTTLFRSGHIRPEDAARHRGEGALSGHGPLRGPAISITGTSTRRRQFGICALRAHGSGRAGDPRVCGPHARYTDEARNAGQGATDGAASALHTTDLRAIPASGGDAGTRRRRALSSGRGADLRGCRAA